MARTAGEQLWAALRALGADCVFGLPGTQTIDAFQALKHSGLRTIVPTHEMAAAFMANGYARVSGRPGILTTIPGPGFTYALTGLAEAWLDSTPVLHVVPAARELPDREHALQAIDQRAMAGPIVKRIVRVSQADAMSAAAVEAYRLATSGEPGPVMLEVAESLFAIEDAGAIEAYSAAMPTDLPTSVVAEVVALIAAAPRILLYLGGGAADSAAAALTLADATHAAVVTTTTARGVISEDDPRVVVRDPGVQDPAVLNALVARADLVVAIGCKFSHNGAAGFHLQIPQSKLVTINAAGPSKNYPARLHATADASRTLAALLPRLKPRAASTGGWDAVELAAWREAGLLFEQDARIEPRLERTSSPVSAIVRELRAALPADAIVVTDSGFHQMSVRRHYTVRSARGLIVPTNFQSMGFALPAAIGAAIAAPHRQVVGVIGDGGMIMSGLELITAVREKIRLSVVVFNDAAYGLIRNAQLSDHGESHGTELMSLDFEALAAATGADYRRIGSVDELAAAIAGDEQGSPVRLVEVPLTDSPGLRRVRARGMMRAAARRLITPKRRTTLARWFRR